LPSGVLVLGAIASVQFGAALAVTLFAQVGPAGVVTLRLSTAAVILCLLRRPRLLGRGRAEIMLACLFGLVLAGMNLCFYEAVSRIPLGIAVSIEFVGPLAVAIAGSRRPADLLWVALAAGGIVALMHGSSEPLNGLGIALALAAGCLWGLYILLNARLGRAFSDSTGLTLAICVAAAAMLPLGAAAAGSSLLSPEALAVGCAVGILASAIPYSLEVEALRRIAPAVFGVLMSLEPAMAALAGFLVLGQDLGVRALVGIAMVILASVGASRGFAGTAPVAQ
jgi:inner membrane transporter RhtA